MNFFRYSIAELFLLMIYAAIIASGFRIHWMVGICCSGVCLGVESGRKTAYPIFLMILAGLVTATLFVLAIKGVSSIRFGYNSGATALMKTGKTLAGRSDAVMLFLDIVLWLSALSCLAWFVYAWSTVGASNPDRHSMRRELESIVEGNRRLQD